MTTPTPTCSLDPLLTLATLPNNYTHTLLLYRDDERHVKNRVRFVLRMRKRNVRPHLSELRARKVEKEEMANAGKVSRELRVFARRGVAVTCAASYPPK